MLHCRVWTHWGMCDWGGGAIRLWESDFSKQSHTIGMFFRFSPPSPSNSTIKWQTCSPTRMHRYAKSIKCFYTNQSFPFSFLFAKRNIPRKENFLPGKIVLKLKLIEFIKIRNFTFTLLHCTDSPANHQNLGMECRTRSSQNTGIA